MRRWLSPEWRRIAGNAAWLMGNQVIVLVAMASVGVWVARALGPANFGILSFALSIVAICSSVTLLGLEKVVVRQLVAEPSLEREILGSALLLRLLAGLTIVVGVVTAGVWLWPDDSQTRWVVAVASLVLPFQAIQVAEFWFAAHVESRYTVRARIGALLISTAGRVGLILWGAPVIWFAGMAVIEIAANAILLVVICRTTQMPLGTWSWTARRMVTLLKESWPLLLAGLAAAAYLRVDQIVLRETHGAEVVGTYAAAAQLVEMTSFVSAAVVASVFPGMIKLRESNPKQYEIRLQQFFDTMTWLAIIIATVVTCTAHLAVRLALGAAYEATAPILALLVWRSVLLFQGDVLVHWLLAERLEYCIPIIIGVAGVTNITLNWWLTPKYGPTGAAVVSLVSQACALFLTPLLFSRARRSLRYLMLAFLGPSRYLWIRWAS